MKKILILTSVFMFFLITIDAQKCTYAEKKEKITVKKIAFITEKLDLSVEEAQKFWPVYNELGKKLEKLRVEKQSIMKTLHHDIESVSEKELEEKTSRLVNIKLDIAKLEVEYFEKYKKVLPIKKVFILHHTEKEFNHKLLRELRGQGHGGPPNRENKSIE